MIYMDNKDNKVIPKSVEENQTLEIIECDDYYDEDLIELNFPIGEWQEV